MKKVQAIAVLPLFALASCGTASQTPVDETPENVSIDLSGEETIDLQEIVDQVELESDISSVETTVENTTTGQVQIIEVVAPYVWPNGENSVFTATLEVLDGVVVAVGGINDKEGKQEVFAQQFPEAILGKPLAWLQVDGISGASLTTIAVNQFLNTVNQ